MPASAHIAIDQVEDPYEPGAVIDVVRSLRDDAIAAMYARGQILPHQLAAARAWQALWRQAEVGNVRSIDPERIRVDGSAPLESVSHRRFKAMIRLECLRLALGPAGEQLLRDVLVAGMTLRDVAAARSLDDRRGSSDLIYLGRRLRECLDSLAHELHLA